jgi:site-specific recombinase XerD
MLLKLYPKVHRRYTSLAVLGPILNGFGTWLLNQGYATDCVREHFCTARRLTRIFEQRGIRSLASLTRTRLRACAPANRLDDHRLAATVHLLERYFESETSLYPPRPRTRIEDHVASFATYLEQVRGLAPSSIERHCETTAALLAHIGYERRPHRLGALTAHDIEAFICRRGEGLGRRALQHLVTHLRAFLRFAASKGEAPTGLDTQIDTPRVYREEQLPRALSWEIVQAFLRAIDRTTPRGLRDYAIFLLISTYGLRASEIVSLTLDDVEWRATRLRIRQRKTGGVLWLPLTDEVATALLDYLRKGRPRLAVRRYRRGFQTEPPKYREVFLRCHTPAGVLKSTAIAEAFQAWSRRSGLQIPFQGVHCLRHSYALHLLRSGLSLKTIGDLLGHRSSESTCVYLRLATDDLREVALSLPAGVSVRSAQENAR